MKDLINDGLHVAWGIWIVICVVWFPIWLVPVMAILPREMEQTYHALSQKTWIELKRHVRPWRYWAGKLRDLAGFLLGGIVVSFLL